MSQIHKVIILNKPLKIRGFTPIQWILLTVSVALAFFVGTKIPQDWKLGNLPVGFIVGMGIFCGALVYVKASEMRPFAWWRNLFLYRLGFVPKLYFPHIEEQLQIYPDPTVIDPTKREEEGYIELD